MILNNCATSAVVPPGHFLQGSGASAAVAKCSNGNTATSQPGTYQPVWLLPDEPAAASCQSCGAGILSFEGEPLDAYSPNDDGTGRPGVLNVARTNISCCELAGSSSMHSDSSCPIEHN
jgi:hypothetical protein